MYFVKSSLSALFADRLGEGGVLDAVGPYYHYYYQLLVYIIIIIITCMIVLSIIVIMIILLFLMYGYLKYINSITNY